MTGGEHEGGEEGWEFNRIQGRSQTGITVAYLIGHHADARAGIRKRLVSKGDKVDQSTMVTSPGHG